MEFLERLRKANPALESDVAILMKLYDEKLWHQLSIKLESLLLEETSARAISCLELYDEFISTFESKINEIKLACLLSLIGRRLSSPDMAIALYERVASGKTKLGTDAQTCLSMDIALMLLRSDKVADAKIRIEDAKSVSSDEAVVHSKVYQAQLEYYRLTEQQSEFYHAAIMFLTYTNLDDLDDVYKRSLAEDMAVAALTGEGIYNFGEVLATPILASLSESPMAWLQPLVMAVNRGSVSDCRQLLKHSTSFPTSILYRNRDRVMEKAALLCVVNIAFHRPPEQRQIPFSELQQRCEVPEEQVERLVMRAMALGLLKGSLDQVTGVFQVTWVLPRVLDKSQLADISHQLGVWADRVKTSLVTIEDQAIELYS